MMQLSDQHQSVAFDDTVQLFVACARSITTIYGIIAKKAISNPPNFHTTRLNIKAQLRQAIVRYNSCSVGQEKLIIVNFEI
jgi:hypothetical protein